MFRKTLAAILVAGAVSSGAAETLHAAGSAVLMAQAADGTPRRVRQIAPDLVAPPELEVDELKRVEPRAPLSEIGPAVSVEATRKPQDVPGIIFGPVATAAGRIEAQGMVIAIAGIEIVEPEQTCRGRRGDWPCGMLARTAFRSFLRGRALDCDLPEGALPARLAVACRVGAQDLGAWLVSNGWAKVSSTGPYAQEQNQALAERRGIFGPGPEQLPAAADVGVPSAQETPPAASPPAAGILVPGTTAVDDLAPAPATEVRGRLPAAIDPFLGKPKGLY